MSRSAITPLRVRVTATYGPVMPSLADLTGQPPEGYEKVVKFIRTPGGSRQTGLFTRMQSSHRHC